MFCVSKRDLLKKKSGKNKNRARINDTSAMYSPVFQLFLVQGTSWTSGGFSGEGPQKIYFPGTCSYLSQIHINLSYPLYPLKMNFTIAYWMKKLYTFEAGSLYLHFYVPGSCIERDSSYSLSNAFMSVMILQPPPLYPVGRFPACLVFFIWKLLQIFNHLCYLSQNIYQF